MLVDLPPLQESDVRVIGSEMMKDYGKELASSRLETIAALMPAREPLYLAVLLRELRSLSGDNVDARVDDFLKVARDNAPNAAALFAQMLERLEVLGADLVGVWATSLALARNGLSPSALARILSIRFGEAGSAASHRIRRALRPYLQQRETRSDYFHIDLEYAAARRYQLIDHRELHAHIAHALQEEWIEKKDAHAMAERFYHLAEAKNWSAVLMALADHAALDARFELASAGQQFSDDVALAYHLAMENGRSDIAQAIVDAFLSILRSEPARRALFTLGRVNAWLAYRSDKRFFNDLLQRGARQDRPLTEIEGLSDEERDLIFRCRSRLAGLIRRDKDRVLTARLAQAEEILKPMLGDTADRAPGFWSQLHVRLRAIMRRPDDRAGTDAYELGYIHFLRGDLRLARRWFQYGAILSQAAGAETGAWISRCLAANCLFIERNAADRFERILTRARRVFDRRAEAGDPDAQRWIMNAIAHSFEVAIARKDATAGRRLHTELQNDPWVAAFETDVRLMHRHDALLAAVERRHGEAVELFRELVTDMMDSEEQKARYLWHYGLALKASGNRDAARRVWLAAEGLPRDAGNQPWQARINRELKVDR